MIGISNPKLERGEVSSLIEHRFEDVNGLRMHYATAGEGPLVVFCHGFPESWYSWRAQMEAVASAGYQAVAPDQRGYGETSAPEPVEAYGLGYLAGDIVALVRALGGGPAILVGHDWGAPVAWTSALLRPDLFRGLALMSVPYLAKLWGGPKPTDGMRRMCGEDKMFYQLYFQEPGLVERELEADPRDFLLRIFSGISGDTGSRPARLLFDRGQRFIDALPPAGALPKWLSEADLDYFAGRFRMSGFRGPINWYRNIDRNAESLSFLAGRLVEQPSLFIAGERDGVLQIYPRDVEALEQTMPRLTKKVLLPGAGHWVQQERAQEVSALLIEFLRAVHS